MRDSSWSTPASAQLIESDILGALTGCVASLAGSEPYTQGHRGPSPSRHRTRPAWGTTRVDLPTMCRNAGSPSRSPNTNQDAVAEHTFTLMLALAAKKPDSATPRQRIAGRWPRERRCPFTLTLGIAGMGRIGKAVALPRSCISA
ncbi:MAG: hypothetical protein U0744_21865 [Gemmataceae bacterium]